MYSAALSRRMEERLGQDQACRSFDYGTEFRSKVSVNYGVYIFLSPKSEGIDLFKILDSARGYKGFEKFRLVHKGVHIIHIYMKYQSVELARMAIKGFKSQWETSLHVASVSDMLEAMYAIETSDRTYPVWTATIIDAFGEGPQPNPLNKQNLSPVLKEFGGPRIYDLQCEGGRVKSVQALFSSMAEALGATIVHGLWFDGSNQPQNFYYRIRIVGGEKEMAIFDQLRIPNVKLIFDMEYFVGGESTCYNNTPQPQVYSNEPAPERVYQQNEYRNNYALNPPAQQTPALQHSRQRGRRSFPRRQFNNRNARQNWDHAQTQQQVTTTQVPTGR